MSENLQTITSSVAKKLRSEDGIDMLSNLPDSILCQIISELETREAVKTSVLSSRYKSLWMNITSLRFDDLRFGPHNEVRFAHFVSRVLSILKSKSIDNLFLKLSALHKVYDVSFWVSAAIGMNVKVLKLHIGREYVDNSISLPSCLYTSKTLVVLQLCVWHSKALILDVPEFVSLPKLTKLELLHVNYSSDDSVRRLIAGCSSLEELIIARDVYDDVGTFTIDCPTLKILNYIFWSVDRFVRHFKFELNAPALVDLQMMDNTSREFSVVNLCSLGPAQIQVSSPITATIESHCERVVKLIQGVYDVNHLWISGDALEALRHRGSSQKSSRRNFSDSLVIMDTSKDFQEFLEFSDDFPHLYLSKGSSDTTHVVQWRGPVELSVCLLSYLETISVCGFRGRESELGMIAYILKSAKLLKKMIISAAITANFELRQKILKFDQGSEGSGRCEITFKDKDEDGTETEMKTEGDGDGDEGKDKDES